MFYGKPRLHSRQTGGHKKGLKMRIASLILPTHDNDGVELNDFHHALKLCLIDSFGGFSALAVSGGWRDDSTGQVYIEPSVRYDIAMEDSADNSAKLESIARFYGHATRQNSVMIVHASGVADFVSPSVSIRHLGSV